MMELPVGHSHGPFVRYVQEASDFKKVDAYLTERDWDVTDPDARMKATVETLGPIDERNRHGAQWFINPVLNTAGLAVYRPSQFSLTADLAADA